MSGRSRRAASKRVDYSKQQDYSDDDIFEDSDGEPAPRARASAGSRRPRKAKANDPNVPQMLPTMMDDEDDGPIVTKPVFTEKGYDITLPPLRERFPFLPEYEEDGSPRIDLIVGRRLVDEKEGEGDDDQKQQASDEHDENEENESVGGPGRKTRRSRASAEPTTTTASPPSGSKKDKGKASDSGPAEYEYLVKFKGRSYLHLEWKTGADLESMNKSAKGIYRRYLKKLSMGTDEDLENPDFDPSYILPEKIIDEADQEITIELTDKELLRWEKQREKELAAEASEEEDELKHAAVQGAKAVSSDDPLAGTDDAKIGKPTYSLTNVPLFRLKFFL